MKPRALFLGLVGACLAPLHFSSAAPAVQLWRTNLVIPTYLAAPPSPVPRFYEGRTYQGARAPFYPYPVQDRLTDERVDRTYEAWFLENAHVRIGIVPELGGRIFSATDKSNGYEFFYRQHVIKPALIGMLGAWISGGVEWNVPHHHRATSFSPVDCTTTLHPDGSATVWVGEIELRHRMKWLVGMTLHPDRSDLELTCRMFNRTPFAHPMLFWINPAVHANTNYQVLFPPGTEWAVQHGKPEFASWPIARQTYGGTDYTRGVDISWWKNHPSPVSFFAWNDRDDWFGGYDHGRQAGVLHVADHHFVPGKKFFEWGNGPEGEMWSKILTDDDGPYLELMAGAWSDNQPDYSWIQPGETREWSHWWYPIRDLGGAKAATRDVAVNLELNARAARIAVNATREFPSASVHLERRVAGTVSPAPANAAGGPGSPALAGSAERRSLFSRTLDLGPGRPFSTTVMLESEMPADTIRLSVRDAEGRDLLTYQPAQPAGTPMPKPVERPKPPKDYATLDELFYTGQRIEQLYSPSFEAAPYYEEMLRRDPGDVRAHTALGMLLGAQWRWAAAEEHLRTAIERAAANYIRPRDTEAFFHLGVALRAQGRWQEAEAALARAAWSPTWRAASGCELAELALQQGEPARALAHADLALSVGAQNPRARNLKCTILRRLGQPEAAERWAAETLVTDPLNVRAASERILAQRQRGAPEWREGVAALRALMGKNPEAFLENAIDLANAGQWSEVVEILRDQVVLGASGAARVVATEHYLLAYALEQVGRADEAAQAYAAAAQTSPEFCFPSRHEEERVFRRAIERDPRDARAPYYLGCLLYDRQPEQAITAWEESRRRDDRFALVHRNLGLAYAQMQKDVAKAIVSLEQAVALDATEPRFLFELDLQYEAEGIPVARRLAMLSRHHDTVALRDEALTREIVLLTVAGRADRSLELLRGRHFRNWEGSSRIHDVYVDACLAQGQKLLAARQWREALQQFEAAQEYPENMEVGRARRTPRIAQIQYSIGLALEALGDSARARAAFEKSAAGEDRGASENQYFRALALQKLGRADDARPIFERLVKAGEDQLGAGEGADYFAKFGEKQSERVRKANAHYLTGLGRAGLGEPDQARRQFAQALELHPAHLGVHLHPATPRP